MHPGSKDTYNSIADWIAPNFFFSKKDGWERMGLLGVFGDYILNCTQGVIVEIGCGESSIYLSQLARKYSRGIYHCDCGGGKIDNPLTVPGYMDAPRSVYYRCTSDEMFKSFNDSVALAFIDGDHTYKQAKKDFDNIWPFIVRNGFVILHDTCPPDVSWTHENACGEVYKLRKELEELGGMDVLSLPRGCAMGVGLTIVRRKTSKEVDL